MIVPDLNVLLYAVDSSSPRHQAAKAWLEAQLSGAETFGFSWSVLLGFLRLSTRSSVFGSPLAVEEAFDLVASWLDQPPVVVLDPTERHLVTMRELLQPLGTAGNLVTDAHLAALAIEHGAAVASSDRDFARFSGLRWVDPLSSST